MPAITTGGASWSWREVHSAALGLIEQLQQLRLTRQKRTPQPFPQGTVHTAICNLCATRLGFLITWLAALRAHCTMILPPSSGTSDVAGTLATHADVIVVVDEARVAAAHAEAGSDCLVLEPTRMMQRLNDGELAWTPLWEQTAAILHTSGSTGAPHAQPKSLRQLYVGAHALVSRLTAELAGGLAGVERIVCSVPPQHMFGFEASVMLPLVHGVPVQEGRPLLPADVWDALSAAGSVWVATPLNLEAMVRSALAPLHCAAAIASTMPLSAATARQSEALLHAPVLEIYGSTETGALASRRTASEAVWRPLESARVESAGETARAWGEHFNSPRVLSDRLEVAADGSFTLHGRRGDLIKIGGRRASLAGLNSLIHELPGVDDGVFYLPASGAPAERLCLICSGQALDRHALIEWLRERLDAAFVPRTLIQIERLPRSDTGKLPRAALDQVYEEWKKRSAQPPAQQASSERVPMHRFELVVPHDHIALEGHFPGRPLVPGALLLDRLLTQLQALTRRRITRLPHVKFAAPLAPGERVRACIEVEQQHARFRVEAERGAQSVLVARGSAWLGERLP